MDLSTFFAFLQRLVADLCCRLLIIRRTCITRAAESGDLRRKDSLCKVLRCSDKEKNSVFYDCSIFYIV